jgi:AcrR family transcriptional regulator
MEASATRRPIEGEKAQRIVDAMRSSVARRGAAGSTFDHVAREAGVSRGLLHYYFGTKERMLAEVVRRDASLRLPLLRERLNRAGSADEIVDELVASLQHTVRDDPEFVTVTLELFALARRHPEVATEVEALLGRMRSEVGEVLAEKERAGIVTLAAPPEVLADLLFAVGDGAAMRLLAEPDRDPAPLLAACRDAVRPLLGPRG